MSFELTMESQSTLVVSGNSTSSKSDEDPSDLLTENPVVGVLIATLLSVLCLLTVFGNAVVLHAIRTERRLQTVSNMFIMSLAIADITVGIVVMPISSAYVLTGRWRFGLVVCQFWLSADYSASTASILNLLVLSLDRYWSISRPLEYLRRRSKKRALVVITIVWIGSFLWIVPIIGWHQFFAGGVRKQPPDVCETEFADNVVFKLTTSTINFYCPMVAMIVTYARIYMQIRKRARSEVMNRCSDVRPDSCSGNSEPTPLRYALATTNPNPPKKQKNKQNKKKKKEDKTMEDNMQVPEVFSPLEIQGAGSSSCEGSCDGSITPATDARWRCNVCGATQGQTEEWSWPQPQIETTKLEFRSNLKDDYCVRNMSDRNCRTQTFQMSRRDKHIAKDISHRVGNDIHLQVPPPELQQQQQQPQHQPPSRSSSFRVLCNTTRGVLRRPSTRRSVASLRQEAKAARQLGVIIGAFVLCWLPYMVLFVVTAACDSCLTPGVHTAAIWLGYFNSTVNPVIYALCNASFKRAFWKIGAGVSAGWSRRCRRAENDPGSENNPFA